MSNDIITFTKAELAEFKTLYEWALKTDRSMFEYRGHQWFVPFAKYVLISLEAQFAEKGKSHILNSMTVPGKRWAA